jgi:N-acyl-L-homoserine lactone synthetase
VVADQEIDRYDLRQDTIYLLAKEKADGPLLASTRLLTTTGPHLMCELFGTDAQDKVPHGPTVLEASRFCTAPEIRSSRQRRALLGQVVGGVIETALLYGADKVVFAANSALLPLALNCGWDARSLGLCVTDQTGKTTAVKAAITTAGLRRVRVLHGVPAPITTIFPSSVLHLADHVASRIPIEGTLARPSESS